MRIGPGLQFVLGEAPGQFLVQLHTGPHRPAVGVGCSLVGLPHRVLRKIGHGSHYRAVARLKHSSTGEIPTFMWQRWMAVPGIVIIGFALREMFHDLFHPTAGGSLSNIVSTQSFNFFRRSRQWLPLAGPLT